MNQIAFNQVRYQYGSIQALDAYLHHNKISPEIRDKYFSGIHTPVREIEMFTDDQLYEFADGFMLGIKEHCTLL